MERITNEEVLERKKYWRTLVNKMNEWIRRILRHEGLLQLSLKETMLGENKEKHIHSK